MKIITIHLEANCYFCNKPVIRSFGYVMGPYELYNDKPDSCFEETTDLHNNCLECSELRTIEIKENHV